MTHAELQPVNLGPHFQITPQGLFIKGKPGFDDFAALGETLRTLDRSLQFALGDFFREVEGRFHEMASQILDHTGWSESTVRAYRWTADKVAVENRRMDVLTYSHHQEVARLEPREQRRWLTRAAQGEDGTPWPVRKLKREMRTAGGQPETAWWVLVHATSEVHQQEILAKLEKQGYTCKAIQRHTDTSGAWGTEAKKGPRGVVGGKDKKRRQARQAAAEAVAAGS